MHENIMTELNILTYKWPYVRNPEHCSYSEPKLLSIFLILYWATKSRFEGDIDFRNVCLSP